MSQCYYTKANNDKILESEWTQEFIDGWINEIKNDKYSQPPIRHYLDSGVVIKKFIYFLLFFC